MGKVTATIKRTRKRVKKPKVKYVTKCKNCGKFAKGK